VKIKRVQTVLVIVFISLLFLSANVLAAEEEKAIPEPPKRALPPLIEELGLSAEQKEQIREQQYEERKKKMEVRNEVRLRELDLQHELGEATPNKEKIDKLLVELTELQGQLLKLRIDAILKLRNILTPEQFDKFRDFGVDIMKARLRGIGKEEIEPEVKPEKANKKK